MAACAREVFATDTALGAERLALMRGQDQQLERARVVYQRLEWALRSCDGGKKESMTAIPGTVDRSCKKERSSCH
jgi:catabolite regulation protein CreA